MNDIIAKARTFAENGLIDEACELLEAMTDGTDSDMAMRHYLLGRMAWKRGHKTDAINHYEQAVAFDPSSDAAVALEQAREIMNFFNKDLYNP